MSNWLYMIVAKPLDEDGDAFMYECVINNKVDENNVCDLTEKVIISWTQNIRKAFFFKSLAACEIFYTRMNFDKAMIYKHSKPEILWVNKDTIKI